MRPIVDKAPVKGGAWEILGKLLVAVCACVRIGDKALQNGDKVAAYRAYDDAYDAWQKVAGRIGPSGRGFCICIQSLLNFFG